jgi:uncharacterized protein YuzE
MTIEISDHPGEPVYVYVGEGKVVDTRQLIEGRVMADFDADGNLLGVEVLR